MRNTRNTKGLSPKESLILQTRDGKRPFPHFAKLIEKLANVGIDTMSDEPRQGVAFLAGTLECSIPLEGKVDASAAKADILKEIAYHKGFLVSVEKKLTNEKFIARLPGGDRNRAEEEVGRGVKDPHARRKPGPPYFLTREL